MTTVLHTQDSSCDSCTQCDVSSMWALRSIRWTFVKHARHANVPSVWLNSVWCGSDRRPLSVSDWTNSGTVGDMQVFFFLNSTGISSRSRMLWIPHKLSAKAEPSAALDGSFAISYCLQPIARFTTFAGEAYQGCSTGSKEEPIKTGVGSFQFS